MKVAMMVGSWMWSVVYDLDDTPELGMCDETKL